MPFDNRRYTLKELRTALLNLQWIIKHREGGYYPDVATITWGDGGSDETDLLRRNFTSASDEEVTQVRMTSAACTTITSPRTWYPTTICGSTRT